MLIAVHGGPVDVEVTLEWEYTPPDCLEQCVSVSTADYSLVIDSGKATARLDPAFYDANPHVRDLAEEQVRSRLLAAQLIASRPFELTGPAVTYLRDDGTARHMVDVACSAHIVLSESVDIQVLDASGNVVRDTKQERIADKAALGALILKHGSGPPYRPCNGASTPPCETRTTSLCTSMRYERRSCHASRTSALHAKPSESAPPTGPAWGGSATTSHCVKVGTGDGRSHHSATQHLLS
jgi:hypothetical protein